MRFIPYILFLFIIGCSFLQVNGQGVFHETFDQQSGLLSESVYDIYKDSKGYIWCTTNEGIVKYNGSEFYTFNSHSNLSLAGSNIKEDKYGRIWYQTFDGYFLYIEKNTLHELPFVQTSGFKPYVIKDNYLYFVSDKGISKTNLSNLKTTLFIPGKGFEYCHLLKNQLYFGANVIYRFDLKKQQKVVFKSIQQPFKSLTTFVVNDHLILTDRIAPETPLYLIHPSEKTHYFELHLNQTIQNIGFKNGSYWMFTPNGIYSFTTHFLPSSLPRILKDKNVSSITEDLDGNYWIGSPNNGIYVIKDLTSKEYSLKLDEFSAISHKKGIIYTGTKSGKILAHSAQLSPTLFYDTKDNNPIHFMDFNSYTNWNFFTGNGFTVYNTDSKKVIHNSIAVKQICKINESTIALAATGLWTLTDIKNLSQGTIIEANAILGIRAKSCVYDPITHTHYIASNKGLLRRIGNRKEYILHKNKPILCKSLVYNKGKIYGLTNNGILFQLKKGTYKEIDNSLRFSKMKFFQNQLYLSGTHEIYRLESAYLTKLRALNKKIRIIDFEISSTNLYILSAQKLIQLSLHALETTNEKPKIYIRSVLFNEKEVDPNNWNKIPYERNSITVIPEIVNFDYHNDYYYHYSINGKPYPISANNATLTLAELSPGTYTISLVGYSKTSHQVVVKQALQPITILPPFWKSWWFMLLISLFIAFGLYVAYRFRLKIIEQKNTVLMNQLELENNLKESRLQLIKSQMNPHFFFNSLNNIQSYIFTNETKEASLYLTKLSRLTRKILEFSDANSISIKDEMEALQLYLEIQKMRFSDLDFEISFEGKENPDNVQLPTMLFQPYVENSILHGLSHSNIQKKLTIHFQLISAQKLVVKIEDNGIGREKSQEINLKNSAKAASFATKANLERIQLLNKDHYNIQITYSDLNPDNFENRGTVVTITIQLK